MFEKKIASNTIYQILTKLTTSASGFIITILIAHTLGAQGYGEYTKITVFVSMFYLVADFGLNAIFLQLNPKDAPVRFLLALRLALSLLIVAIVNLLIFIMPFNPIKDIGFSPDLRLAGFFFSLTIVSEAIVLSATAIFQKKLRYDLYMYSIIAGMLLTLGLIFLSTIIFPSLEYILLSYVLGGGLTSLIALILLKEKIMPLKVNLKFSKHILLASLPLGLMLFFNLIYFRIDLVILSLYRSTTEVALYGYAFKYFEFLLAISLFLSNAVYPFLLRSLKNLRRNYEFSHKYMRLSLLLSVIILIPAWFVAPVISVVKSDFVPSVDIFRILLLSLPIFFLTSILQWVLIAKNKNTYLLKAYIIGALVNTLLNLILIPTYGYTAAAIITGVSEMVILVLLYAKFLSLESRDQIAEKFTNHGKNYDKQK